MAGSALSEDIYQNFLEQKASRSRRLLVARIGIFIVGIIPLIFIISGYAEGELVQFIVILFTAIMGAGFFTPVVGGILWKRATKHGAIAAMIGGVVTTGLWKAYGDPLIYPVLPGFIVSILAYLIGSWCTKPPPESAWKPYFTSDQN